VFITNPDPVGLKLVSSLAHPGGNITGLSSMGYDLAVKRLEILKEAIPNLSRVALLVNPYTPYDASRQIAELQSTADQLRLSIEAFEARQPEDLEPVFKRMKQGAFGATIITQNAMFYNERKRLAELSLTAGLPSLAPADVFIGAFMSYGPVWTAMFRNAGGYVDKILKGAKPADLPVQQPTEFRLVINLKTAKALGLTISPTLLARADEVIE
jgi:putative ABC transport system substrate-binding protein